MGSQVVLWFEGQEPLFRSRFKDSSKVTDTFYIEIPSQFDADEFSKRVKKESDDHCYLNGFIKNDGVISLRVKYLGHDAIGFKFEVPDRIFRAQRRGEVRYSIPSGYDLTVQLPNLRGKGPPISRKLFDISTGGISLLTTSNELEILKPGLILRHVVFVLRGRKIQVDVEVRHVQKPNHKTENPEVRIGMQFKKLGTNDENFIAAYVAEHMISAEQYVSR